MYSKGCSPMDESIPQHIYITVDEKIEDGDWIIHFDFNNNPDLVTQCTGILKDQLQLTHKECKLYKDLYQPIGQYRKIIATTDTSLKTTKYNDDEHPIDSYSYLLPKPSQDFINKYIEKYNKGEQITSILVEYEEY